MASGILQFYRVLCRWGHHELSMRSGLPFQNAPSPDSDLQPYGRRPDVVALEQVSFARPALCHPCIRYSVHEQLGRMAGIRAICYIRGSPIYPPAPSSDRNLLLCKCQSSLLTQQQHFLSCRMRWRWLIQEVERKSKCPCVSAGRSTSSSCWFPGGGGAPA